MDQRWTTLSTVFNFRDLGGLPGLDGHTVHSGRLFRSDSLHRLSAADRDRLAVLGIRTVLDLRRPHEIERDGRVPESAGYLYHNVYPVHREWDPEAYDEIAGPARYLADRYRDMADEGRAGLGRALCMIAEADRAPLVMHCFAGKDRTGVLAALTLSLLGVPDPEIAMDYARSEAAQGKLTARIIAEAPGPQPAAPIHFVVCPPEAILLFLTELRAEYGSVRDYVMAAGVSDGHVAALRAHLLG